MAKPNTNILVNNRNGVMNDAFRLMNEIFKRYKSGDKMQGEAWFNIKKLRGIRFSGGYSFLDVERLFENNSLSCYFLGL